MSSARSPTSRVTRCRYSRGTFCTDRQRSRRPSFSGAYDGVPERSNVLAIAGPFPPTLCLSSFRPLLYLSEFPELRRSRARFFEFPRVRSIVNARCEVRSWWEVSPRELMCGDTGTSVRRARRRNSDEPDAGDLGSWWLVVAGWPGDRSAGGGPVVGNVARYVGSGATGW